MLPCLLLCLLAYLLLPCLLANSKRLLTCALACTSLHILAQPCLLATVRDLAQPCLLEHPCTPLHNLAQPCFVTHPCTSLHILAQPSWLAQTPQPWLPAQPCLTCLCSLACLHSLAEPCLLACITVHNLCCLHNLAQSRVLASTTLRNLACPYHLAQPLLACTTLHTLLSFRPFLQPVPGIPLLFCSFVEIRLGHLFAFLLAQRYVAVAGCKGDGKVALMTLVGTDCDSYFQKVK